ncbi:NAD(P)/FAD-dependent oxidoreductase [Microcoleus sp. FACHB-672]|uniref:NAD(P)/FAD-dependent oxidoreductase n=1 Tax=Microcoleus sp. FACHB-672 TaxID=2692825 RepID=UPI0016886E5A|nr:NAD(P)/FAD-dependent oxidoreductase [Microcoleus sp. FACHB-672]MBD2041410.1 NAD(P)/FAD-dependent oxidoreductase [Microcoleus sp. FACHB-672]
MKSFDVVVVGAGPSGGQCARLLAKSGKKVLLVEQYENFYKNNFSSAGTPIETLNQFDLPEDVVGSFWDKIVIVTTKASQTWQSEKRLGAVLNFAKLREFLAREVESQGGEVWMGYRYIRNEQNDGKTIVEFKQRTGDEILQVSTQVLVDATGPVRALMYEKESDKPDFLSGTGIEYLIEVSEEDYNKYSQSLIFFLGHKWMPKGYSWIFPMENNLLKVGAGRLNETHKIVTEKATFKHYIELIIKEYIQAKEYKIVEIHGATLQYSKGLQDIYYKNNIIAIGDAVSTVNFLGGEGIRHGMYSAEIACDYISKYLDNQIPDFADYQKQMQQHFATKWNLSERLGMKKYLEDSDELIDKGVSYLSSLTAEDLMEILFHYNFSKLYKGFSRLLKRKIYSLFQGVRKAVNWKFKIQ